MSSELDVESWMRSVHWPTDRVRHLLLPRGAPYTCIDSKGARYIIKAFGAGIINIMGTSGSGKSTLANALMNWVTIHSPVPRPLCYLGMPDEWLEVLPPEMKKVAYTLNGLDELHKVKRGSIMLLDDTGLHAAARRSMSGSNVKLSIYSQIARHRDVAIIMTAQNHRVVDFAANAVVESADLIKWYSLQALESERDEKRGEIYTAQQILRSECGNSAEKCLPFYWSVQDRKLATYPCVEWLLDDRVGRPFGLIDEERLKELLG